MKGRGGTAVACILAILVVGVAALNLLSMPGAEACSIGQNAANRHTTNGIDHGWSRTWSCDHYTYTGITYHSHGSKYVAIYRLNPDRSITLKCSSLVSGSTGATCSVNTSSTQIESWHDTGDPLTCDLYNDGHGICSHFMEPIP